MSISVQFANKNGVFYPGTEVNGTVILNLESSIKARGVGIFIDGRAHTHWTESESHRHTRSDGTTHTERRTITYEATVIYAHGEAAVWSDSPSCDKLHPGEHQFPFKFLLPVTCAPSFEGCYGYIRYQVRVEIDRKWRFNKSNKKFFTVAPTFDLNFIPQAIMPVKDMKCKETGMIFFRHGKVMVEASIPKMGFVPGEAISTKCVIDNDSSRAVEKVEIKLNQVSRYVAARSGWSCHYSDGMSAHHCTHRREEKRIVARIDKMLEVSPKAKAEMVIPLPVPACVASFNTCPLISVEYYVSIKLHLRGTINNTVQNNLPILIGTIPVYQQTLTTVAPSTPYPTAPYPSIGMPSNSISSSTVPPYPMGNAGPQVSPPSYEESIYGTAGTTKDMENSEAFAPRYPVYHNLPPVGFINNPSAPPLPEKI